MVPHRPHSMLTIMERKKIKLGCYWSKLLCGWKYVPYFFLSSVLNTNRINDRIALNVNADKAPVLGKSPGSHSSRLELNNNIISGAALHGASLSRQFENMMSVSTTYKLLMLHLQLLTIMTLVFTAGSKSDDIQEEGRFYDSF